MTAADPVIDVLDALSELGANYMLVGSLASNFHGVPRATADADLVIESASVSLSALGERLGTRFSIDPQSGFETVTGTTRHLIRVRDTPFTIELFLLSDDEHDRLRFANRLCVSALGRTTYVLTANDVVVTKLRWAHHTGRTKDLDDARNVIAVQGDRLDWRYIEHWCERHGTRALLDRVRHGIPPL